MNSRAFDEDDYQAYYREISDGCGCTELWEYLSERRYEWTKPDERR